MARTESDAGATGAGSSGAETEATAAGAQAEGEAARAEEPESGIEKGESNVHMEHSRVDSTGSPVRSEPPPETDEQRATRIYEEKLKRYNEVANELKSSSAKVSDVPLYIALSPVAFMPAPNAVVGLTLAACARHRNLIKYCICCSLHLTWR